MHSCIVACQSKSLEKLINGDMKEANDRCVVWPDVDSDTFIRFSQYAYTGDYQAAPRQTRDHTTIGEPSPTGSNFPSQKITRIKKKKPSMFGPEDLTPLNDKDLWAQFKKLYPDAATDQEAETNAPEDDFSVIFLSHARLYVFADCYDISALKVLCLRKLQQILVKFTVHEEAIDDIIRLVRFCYENTLESDEMRGLVDMYTACKAVELWRSQLFQRLVMDTSEYAWGFISEILKRVD